MTGNIYSHFVKERMKHKPHGVSAKDHMKTIAEEWRGQEGGSWKSFWHKTKQVVKKAEKAIVSTAKKVPKTAEKIAKEVWHEVEKVPAAVESIVHIKEAPKPTYSAPPAPSKQSASAPSAPPVQYKQQAVIGANQPLGYGMRKGPRRHR
jgi:hypothetical protein